VAAVLLLLQLLLPWKSSASSVFSFPYLLLVEGFRSLALLQNHHRHEIAFSDLSDPRFAAIPLPLRCRLYAALGQTVSNIDLPTQLQPPAHSPCVASEHFQMVVLMVALVMVVVLVLRVKMVDEVERLRV